MSPATTTRSRLLPALGALLAGASVALAAYAAHADAPGLASAAWLGRLPRVALAMLMAGAWLFAGSLAAKHFLDLSSPAAPAGGLLMIAGWVVFALSCLRR